MARITNSILEGMTGSVGELVFYKVGGKTYSRRKPGKQSKSTIAKTSEIKRRAQSVNTQAHAFLRYLTHILKFGYQNQVDGARREYHAAISHASKNSFTFEGKEKVLDISLVKISLGSLLGPLGARAERVSEGAQFTWKDNSWNSSAKPSDNVFLVLHSLEPIASEWVFIGNTRVSEKQVITLSHPLSMAKWHAWIAFSQENPWTKKRILSESVYLGHI